MDNIKPDKSKVWDENYITYRRLWLDTILEALGSQMRGMVLDLGGKRIKKRGAFNPPERQVEAWWYVNLDSSTSPNIYADVAMVPLRDQSVDVVICTEVLEHIDRPHECVKEIFRILGKGGVVYVSVPFLYPVHADPFDFQRFTADGLRYLFRNFSSIEILEMGGFAGTLGMFIDLNSSQIEGNDFYHRLFRKLSWLLSRYLCWLDLIRYDKNHSRERYTTGYFARIQK